MPLSAGDKLGPYEIRAPLGAGGMGEVYRANDTRLDRTVAIKVLLASLSSDPSLKQRLEREAKAVPSPHLHAVRRRPQGRHGFSRMEFLDGETLERRLEKARCHPSRRFATVRRLPTPWPKHTSWALPIA